jgi:virulence-associated protein VapD
MSGTKDIKIMYAIAFDFDTDKLKTNYPGDSWQNAYGEVRKFLSSKGFGHQQGTVYYGDNLQTQVTTMCTVFDLSKQFPYLKNSIADIRILQLLDADDLMPMIIRGNPS